MTMMKNITTHEEAQRTHAQEDVKHSIFCELMSNSRMGAYSKSGRTTWAPQDSVPTCKVKHQPKPYSSI